MSSVILIFTSARMRGCLCFLLLVMRPLVAAADSGTDWLVSQLKVDGSIASDAGITSPYQSTAVALRIPAVKSSVALQSLEYLATEAARSPENISRLQTEQLARYISAAVDTDILLDDYVSGLAVRQNPDGGFGANISYASNPLDTALALEAMVMAGTPEDDASLGKAVGYLLGRQLDNGGWKDGANEASVYVTAWAMSALGYFRDQYADIPQSLTAGVNFLLSRRDISGTWSEAYETALAMLAILPLIQDTALLLSNADALVTQQDVNGSWGNDVYSTALAVMALQGYKSRSDQGNRTATLTGYVRMDKTGAAIAGATVSINQGVGIDVTTNAEGYYVIPLLAPGTYTVLASRSGYQSSSIAVRTETGRTSLAGDLVMSMAPQTAIVTGNVFAAIDVQPAGQPLAAATILLEGAQIYSCISDGSGYFAMDTVEPGVYSLSITKDGYYPLNGSVTVTGGQRLQINQGLVLEGAIQEAGKGDIYGHIVDARTGLALSGVHLDMGSIGVDSDTNGDFRFLAIARGNYTMDLSLLGYQDTHYSLMFPAGASGDMGALLLPPLQVALAPETLSLLGQVVDGVTQKPLAGAKIFVSEPGLTTVTAADGSFYISNLTQTSLHILISADGYNDGDFSVQANGFGEMNARFTLSPPGDGASEITLTGRVTARNTGLPLAGAVIEDEKNRLSTVTDDQGGYTLSGIPDLNFVLSISATGYETETRVLQLDSYGHFALNQEMTELAGKLFQIEAVHAAEPSWEAGSTALFTAEITNISASARDVSVVADVINASGTRVATVSGYQAGSQQTGSQINFKVAEIKTVTLPWYTAQLPPGVYTMVVRVIEPQTMTEQNRYGVVLAESTGRGQLLATATINGVVTPDPPLSQAGSTVAVNLTALIRNAGNIPLENVVYQLVIYDPARDVQLHTAFSSETDLGAGDYARVDFGQWQASSPGNLDVIVHALDEGVSGEINSKLYIGNMASGRFMIDRETVAEGDQSVRAHIDLQGVDLATGISTDPLYALVRDSAERAGAYVSRESVAWHRRSRCLGCHIQSQSLAGLANIKGGVLTGEQVKARYFLRNALITAQLNNGLICRSTGCPQQLTEHALNVWALSALTGGEGDADSSDQGDTPLFRALYKALEFAMGLRTDNGDKVYWQVSWDAGWFNSNESHTAMIIRGIAALLRMADTSTDPQQVSEMKLGGQRFWAGSTMGPRDMEFGADGQLYMVKKDNDPGHWWYPAKILRKDFSGGISEVASLPGDNPYGLAVAGDGTVFLATQNRGLVRINADATQDTVLMPGEPPLAPDSALFDVELGPDDMLYVSDFRNHQIIRMDQFGQNAEVLAKDGLLNSPKGLAFDGQGLLLVANNKGYNILRLLPDNTLTVVSDGLYYRPEWLDVNSQNQIYVTSSGNNPLFVYRIDADGRSEMLHLEDNDWLNEFQGILVDHKSDQVYLASYYGNHIHTLIEQSFDSSRLDEFRASLSGAVRYLISRYNAVNPNNSVHATIIQGLADARPYISDASLLQEIDSTIIEAAVLLRNRQLGDGGWSQYYWSVDNNTGSDPLMTALIGLALENIQPSPDDPAVRQAIGFLLGTQVEDGSWYNVNNGLTSRLAASSFVLSYLPTAMERLGGIDVELHLVTTSSSRLMNPSSGPDKTAVSVDGKTQRVWSRKGVTGSGSSLEFDIDLQAMQLNERRAVADAAWLTFKNSFTNEVVRLDLVVPTVTAHSGLYLGLMTDKSSYQHDEEIKITSMINNQSSIPAAASIKIAIHASSDDTVLFEFPSQMISNLAGGGALDLVNSWSADGFYSGKYEIVGKLIDAEGRILDETRAYFDISSSDVLPELTITADKPLYQSWDVITLKGRIRNIASHSILPASRIEASILDADGNPVYFATRFTNELAENGFTDQVFRVALKDAAAGDYSVTIVLKNDFTRKIITSRTLGFEVERSILQGLVGRVDVNMPSVYSGEQVGCSGTVTNLSSDTIVDPDIRFQLVRGDTGDVINESPFAVNSLAGGDSNWMLNEIDTGPLGLGGYVCAIKAAVAGETRILGYGGFRIDEPPILISTSLEMGDRGRILVLVDPYDMPETHRQYRESNKTHDEKTAELNVRAHYSTSLKVRALRGMLDHDGWSYHVSDSSRDFSTELRSGAYSQLIILSSKVDISERDRHLIRELVFNGMGMLVARTHGRDNGWLGELAGIRFYGFNSVADGAVFVSSIRNGQQLILSPAQKVAGIRLTDADILARFISGVDGKSIAITTNKYGYGQVIYAAVDFLDLIAYEMYNDLAPAWLLSVADLITLSHPQVLSYSPGKVVPLNITLVNDGIDVSGKLLGNIGNGIAVVESISDSNKNSGLSDSDVVWPFSLSEGETKNLVLWLRILKDPGVVISFKLQVDEGPDLVDYGDNLSVEFAAESVPDISELITIARKLDLHGHQRLLDRLEETSDALGVNDDRRAVRSMLQVVKIVKNYSQTDVNEFRHRCDDLLQQLMQNIRIDSEMDAPDDIGKEEIQRAGHHG